MHFGAEPQVGAQLRQPLRQPVVEALEPATEIPELGGAVVDAGPEPGHGDLVRQRPELAAQQWAPDDVVAGTAHVAADPVGRGLPFQPIRSGQHLQVGQPRAHADAVRDGQWAEAQEGGGRIQLMDLAITQRDRERPGPDQVVAQAELFDEADGEAIATEEVVIELVQPHAGLDLEACRQPARKRLALDQHHLVAALREPVGDGQAEGACPEHGGARHLGGSAAWPPGARSERGRMASSSNGRPTRAYPAW